MRHCEFYTILIKTKKRDKNRLISSQNDNKDDVFYFWSFVLMKQGLTIEKVTAKRAKVIALLSQFT